MKVLVACEFSGIVRDAFIKKGHDAMSCDLLPTESPGPHYQGDVFDIIYKGWDLMIAHPPCTYLTVAGNKWFKDEYKERFPNRQANRENAIRFFMSLVNSDINKICIENPVGVISSEYKKPDQYIHPYQFGHTVSKKTGLWLKNLPQLKPTKIIKPEMKYNRNGKRASIFHDECLRLPEDERKKARSRTFQGIADAMANQWG